MLTSPLPDGRVPVLLSAHDEELIGQDARAILDYLGRAAADTDTAAVASTLLRLRRVRRHRAVVRAADATELASGLSALARGEEHPLVTHSSAGVGPCIAFVFPGQGNQWQSMGAEAHQRLPAYRAEADRCAQAFLTAGLPSPLPYLTGELDQSWSRTEIQGAQFTHAVSLAHEWRFHGVLPAIAIGHSLGEVAAAYVAGTISLPDAVALVGARATIVDQLAGHYAMAVLGAGVDEAESLIGETAGWLEVSAVNGPSSTVVSGDHDAVAAAVRLARQRGVFTHQLSVDYPGHTSVLRRLRTQLGELVPRSAFQDGPVRFVGSTFGAEVGSDVDFSQYWYENLCNTVRFDHAVAAAQRLGASTFVELSAHPSLLYPLADLIDERDDRGRRLRASRRRRDRRARGEHRNRGDRRSRLPMGQHDPRWCPAAAARVPERADAGRAPLGGARTAGRDSAGPGAHRRGRGLAACDITTLSERGRCRHRHIRRGPGGRRIDTAADRRRCGARRLAGRCRRTTRKYSR